MRKLLILLSFVITALLASAVLADMPPVQAQTNGCADQVFGGATLRYTLNYGSTYQLVPPIALYALRGITACPITSAVTLGQYQALGFMADQAVMAVWASKDGRWYYVHREWRVYPLTAAQWAKIVAVINLKAAH